MDTKVKLYNKTKLIIGGKNLYNHIILKVKIKQYFLKLCVYNFFGLKIVNEVWAE